METTQKPMKKLLKFVGSLISWIFKGVLILVLILFVAMGIKIIERWNQPMQIPEAQGMIYSQLIKNRLDGWNRNQDRYGESIMHCKVITIGGLALSIPVQIIYTYVGINPDSEMLLYIDPNDIQANYLPANASILTLANSWWWVLEKFSWGTLVIGVAHSSTSVCRLPIP